MRFLLAFLSFFLVSFANTKQNFLFQNFINQEEVLLLNQELSKFKNDDFNLSNSLAKFQGEEFKIALSMIFLSSGENLNKLSFRDLTKIYFFSPQLQKREFIFSKIKSYVSTFSVSRNNFEQKLPEIEEMIWFFLIIENNNLINYLNSNNYKIQDFIEKIKKTKDFNIFKNIVYSREEQASSLLWQGKVTEAMEIISTLNNNDYKNILLARVYFQTQNQKFKDVAKKIIKNSQFQDEGLVYDYIKYLSKTEHYKESLALISKISINLDGVNVNKMWNLVESLFYQYMANGEYFEAYQLVSKIKVTDEKNIKIFVRAKFLSGFVALRFLKEPNIAISYFKSIYDSKNVTVYAKSRGAYFIAQSYKALNNKNNLKSWLNKASKYVNTFYGLLAIEELNGVEPVLFLGSKHYTENKIKENLKKRDEIHKFYFDDLFKSYYKGLSKTNALEELKTNIPFKIGILMLYLDRPENATDFFTVSKAEMSLPQIKLAFDILQDYLILNQVKTTRRILDTFSDKASNQGVILVENYPIINFVLNKQSIKYNALVHAVIKHESNFKIKAISGAGALGLMQVIPSTGRIVSKNLNINFNIKRLHTDYKYNILIGSFYIETLLTRFENSHPYSLIGYNAGPGRVSTWKQRYFEPKTIDEMIDFIELIPIIETRNYVLRVMENEAIYNYLLKNHLSQSFLPIEQWKVDGM